MEELLFSVFAVRGQVQTPILSKPWFRKPNGGGLNSIRIFQRNYLHYGEWCMAKYDPIASGGWKTTIVLWFLCLNSVDEKLQLQWSLQVYSVYALCIAATVECEVGISRHPWDVQHHVTLVSRVSVRVQKEDVRTSWRKILDVYQISVNDHTGRRPIIL